MISDWDMIAKDACASGESKGENASRQVTVKLWKRKKKVPTSKKLAGKRETSQKKKR